MDIKLIREGFCGDSEKDRVFFRLYDNGLLEIYGEGVLNAIGEEDEDDYYADNEGELRFYFSLFSHDKVTDVVIGEGITAIKSESFRKVPMRSVTLPTSLRYVEANSFQECKNLETVIIPDGPLEFSNYAFGGISANDDDYGKLIECPSLSDSSIKQILKHKPFRYQCDGFDFTINPVTLEAIVDFCSNVNYPSELVIPGTVVHNNKTYTATEFRGCYERNIEKLTLPSSIRRFYENALVGFSGLKFLYIGERPLMENGEICDREYFESIDGSFEAIYYLDDLCRRNKALARRDAMPDAQGYVFKTDIWEAFCFEEEIGTDAVKRKYEYVLSLIRDPFCTFKDKAGELVKVLELKTTEWKDSDNIEMIRTYQELLSDSYTFAEERREALEETASIAAQTPTDDDLDF